MKLSKLIIIAAVLFASCEKEEDQCYECRSTFERSDFNGGRQTTKSDNPITVCGEYEYDEVVRRYESYSDTLVHKFSYECVEI